MNKVIEFELDYTLPETGYYCTCCKHTDIDHSGKYYPASDYEALEAKLAAAAERINELQKELDESRTTHSMNLAEKLRLSQKRNEALQAKLAALERLIQEHQTYQTKQGEK